MVIKAQSDVDGYVECPECGEDCGDANLRVIDSGYVSGGSGNLWGYNYVKHTEDGCGHKFEVGGQIGVTQESIR